MAPDPTVFLVDDEPCVVESLSFRLMAEGLRCKTFTSAHTFLTEFDPSAPGCLVVDVRMPEMPGLELIHQIRSRRAMLPIIVLTAFPHVPGAVEAMKGGAIDYFDKNNGEYALIDGIHQALRLDAEVRRRNAERAVIRARMDVLTARQRRIMDLVVAGRSSREIAALVGRHKKTIESHRDCVMEKMQAQTVVDLVRMVVIASTPDD